MVNWRCGVFCSLLLSFIALPRAQASIYDEFQGSRSAAMGGAHRGVGTSNDTVYMNPAGMSMFRRYAIESHYGYSPHDRLSRLNVSAVDSQSGPVAGSLAYTHDRGDKGGVNANMHRFYFGTSYAIGQALSLGFTTKYIRGAFNNDEGRQDINLFTADIGIMAAFAGFAVGVAYNNLLPTKEKQFTPPTLGTGIAYNAQLLTIAADAVFDFSPDDGFLVDYHAGAEYFLGGAFPLRLGYTRDTRLLSGGKKHAENHITAGVGWSSRSTGVDITYRHSLNEGSNWGLIGGLKFYL